MCTLGGAALISLLALVACTNGGAPAGESEPTSKDTSSAFAASDWEFVAGTDMKSRRERFATVTMDDGRVFAVGGRAVGLQAQSGNFNETAEVLDPATTAWASISDMNEQRKSPALFALPDGRVMVAGGLSGQRLPLASTEIWNPGTDEWVFGPEMVRSHDLMASVVLGDGRFLMIGGTSQDEDDLLVALNADTEVFDPSTQTWSEVASMNEKRANHTATLLTDGRVLVAGGGKTDGPYLKATEIYDPASDSWTVASPMSRGRAFHTATLLPDGRVLVVGGKGKLKQAEVYDPSADTWSPAGETADPRSEHTATLLPNGTVLVTGGTGYLPTSEVYDPETGSWSAGPMMGTGRYRHAAVTLLDGRTLILGGTGKDGMLATVEIYSVR